MVRNMHSLNVKSIIFFKSIICFFEKSIRQIKKSIGLSNLSVWLMDSKNELFVYTEVNKFSPSKIKPSNTVNLNFPKNLRFLMITKHIKGIITYSNLVEKFAGKFNGLNSSTFKGKCLNHQLFSAFK